MAGPMASLLSSSPRSKADTLFSVSSDRSGQDSVEARLTTTTRSRPFSALKRRRSSAIMSTASRWLPAAVMLRPTMFLQNFWLATAFHGTMPFSVSVAA